MYRVLLIVIAVIVYGSLYPWDFHSAQLAASPLWVFIHSWPRVVDRFLIRDITVNVLLYMPVGVFGFLALRQNVRTALAVTVTVLIGLTLSSSIEMIQLFDDARECSASDMVCNVSGTVLGVTLGSLYQQWITRFLAQAEKAKFLHPSGAVLLLYTWLAYQAFPLFPALSRTRLAEKFRALFADVSISPIETFTFFVEWLVVAQLLRKCTGRTADPPIVPSPAAGAAGQTFNRGQDSHLVRIGRRSVGVYLLILLKRISGARSVLSVGLIVSLLILRGLAPYHWSSVANPFSWIPFSGFLAADREFGMLTFVRKCFWYGSAVWLLRAAGWRLARAAVAVALLLGAIEIIQIHLPGQGGRDHRPFAHPDTRGTSWTI